ncbi:uncharacterized protein LOC144924408 isoform X1 [Branchiostoma floridae x Branchiostoma belcheri]
MVRRCVAYGCSGTTKLGLSLHSFPSSRRRRRLWTQYVQRRRNNWTGGAKAELCSRHFSSDQFVGGLEREFGIRKRVQLKPTAVPDVHAFDERPAESGASSAVSGSRTAFEKRRRQQIIADLLEQSVQDQNLSEDKVDIEVVAELKNSVGTQTKSSGRHRATQVTPARADAGVQCTLLAPPPENEDTDSEPESEEEEDDDDDEDYFPSEEELSDTDSDDLETEEIHLPDESVPPQEERKYLVFHSALLQLFSLCLLCGSGKQKLRLETIGSFLSITQICTLCEHVRTWSSQPFICNTPAGNLLISAAVLFAGAIPQQALNVFACLRLHCISARTFFRHQRMTLHLAIKNVWSRKQEGMFAALHEGGQALILGGDGRADSPGHSAKYGSYTLMDLRTKKILTLQLVQSNEVGSSNAMEKEGLARAIDFIRRNCTLQIGKIVTDRHLQIAKWIRENLPETCHLYDIWHIAKGLRKKLSALAKQKECEVVGDWTNSIVNHLYWCSTTTREGAGDLVEGKWLSLDNHLHNVHSGHSEAFPQCAHGPLRRQWLKPNTKASVKLSAIITKKSLLKDIRKLSPKYQTAHLEAFHSTINHLAPKWAAFFYMGMLSRLHLAALHHNENCGRGQARNKDGERIYKIRYKKFKKSCTVQAVQGSCTFDYVTELTEEAVRLCEEAIVDDDLMEIPPTLTSTSGADRLDKEAAIQAHRTRFSIDE